MNSTLNLYVCLSNPARSALIANGSSRFAPPAPEFVVRDTVTLRVRFFEKVEGSITAALEQVDIGEEATLTFGAKLKAEILTATTFLFGTNAFTRVEDGDDIYWQASLNLNTEEFIDEFEGSGSTLGLVCELEIEEGSEIRTATQFDANGVFDVIQGGEGAATPAVPPLPSAPAANTLLGGSSDGLSWVQRTVAQTKTLLAYAYTEITGLVAAIRDTVQRASVANSTGNTTITVPAGCRIYTVDAVFTGAAGTRILAIDTADLVGGEILRLDYTLPATAGIVIEVRNATTGGTLLDTLTTDTSADSAFVELTYSGTVWQFNRAQYPAN